jgi:putative lipoprotein
MRLTRTLLSAALITALAACNRTPSEPAPAPAPEPVAAPTPPPAPAAPMRLRGAAVMGKDGYGITPCGDAVQKIVTFDGGAQTYMDEFFKNGAKEFFVDGWATVDADGTAHFTTIERADVQGTCDEKDLSMSLFRARGNEPFWNVDVTPQGVTLQRPDQPDLKADFAPLEKTADGGRKFASEAFTLTLTPGFCHDGMSEATYGWNATVTAGADTLKGCGFAGLVAE